MTSSIKPSKATEYELGRFTGGSQWPLMAMLEITNRCNMSCPLCFTDAQPKAADVVRYDKLEKTLHLSAIFDWYEEDFLTWLGITSAGQEMTIVDYILPYLKEETAELINNDRDSVQIVYLPYDWGLNDQGAGAENEACMICRAVDTAKNVQ